MYRYTKFVFGTLLLACVAITSGCGRKATEVVVIVNEPVNLVGAGYDSVDQLLKSPRVSLPTGSKVVTTTFVNLDDVTASSQLGRLFGENCSSRLTQKGFEVVALKLRNDAIVIQPNSGEFVLSRDMAHLKQKYCADAVLVGMYTRTRVDTSLQSVQAQLADADPYYDAGEATTRTFTKSIDVLYVSMRLISTKDSSVIAAYDYSLPCDDGINSLMSSEGNVLSQ